MVSQSRFVRFSRISRMFPQRSGIHRWLPVLSFLVASLPFFTTQASAQHQHGEQAESAPLDETITTTLAELTQALIQSGNQPAAALSAQARQSLSPTQSSSANDLLAIAQARHRLLTSIIDEHPEEVLRATIPSSVRSHLPPDVQAYVEEAVVREGEVELRYEERPDGCHLRYVLKNDEEELSLHFTGIPSQDLTTGTFVLLQGVQVDSALALKPSDAEVLALPATSSSVLGEQRTLVMLVNFRDKLEQPESPTDTFDTFEQASAFFLENSLGQTWLTTDVMGWFTLALDSTTCNTSQIASLSKAAATEAGFQVSSYKRFVYVFPSNACSWLGLGTLGGTTSQAWLNGGSSAGLVNHEMGHNLGLYHAHALDCGTSPIAPPCISMEYGDGFDVMGASIGGAHYNAFHKEQLGWWPDLIQTVQASGTYVIEPSETPAGVLPKALKIPRSSNMWYYVEYRQAIGFDSFLSNPTFANVRNGALIHLGEPADGNKGYLLDMTPETATWYDPALTVGKSFTDPVSGITLTTLSANSAGITVSVAFHSPPPPPPSTCTRANPTVTLTPSQSQSVAAGTAVTFSVAVTNNDTSNCPTATLNLQASLPNSAWNGAFGSPTLTITPGASSSTTFNVTSPVSAGNGTYSIGVSAVGNGGTTGGASANYVVATSNSLTVSTNRASYQPKDWVTVTIMANFSSSTATRTKLDVIVVKPNSQRLKKVIHVSPRGGTKQGSNTYQFQLRSQDPSGTYQIIVQQHPLEGAVAPAPLTEASTHFTVP